MDCVISVMSRTGRHWLAYQKYQPLSQEIKMNKDQVKGAAKDFGGKIQEEVGKLVGSTEQQTKGLKNQAEGKVQEHVGDLKEKVKDARDAVKDALKP
jgi:uncharacterized protein YjbJ (UPF0337 family)